MVWLGVMHSSERGTCIFTQIEWIGGKIRDHSLIHRIHHHLFILQRMHLEGEMKSIQ